MVKDFVDKMVKDFVDKIDGVRKVGFFSAEGIPLGGYHIGELPEIVTAILAMADSYAKESGAGSSRRVVIDLGNDGTLVFMWVGTTACLAVQADGAHMELLAEEMTRFASRLKTASAPKVRTITGTINPDSDLPVPDTLPRRREGIHCSVLAPTA